MAGTGAQPAFRLLGGLEIRGVAPEALGGPKQRAVLAYLLLHANELVARDRLIDAVWDGRPPPTAAKIVQTYIGRHRVALAHAPCAIVTRSPGYVLELPDDALDVSLFEQRARDGRDALRLGEPQSARDLLGRALELWRGEPLVDIGYEPLAQHEAERLVRLRFEVLVDRIEAELALGEKPVAELEELIAAHPFEERPRELLMLALYRSARQADALAAYRETRRLFAEELGIEPGLRLQELERAVLRHDASILLPQAVRSRLPLAVNPLLGRTEALAELVTLLRRDDVRLLTLTATAGAGKTRLALEAARTAQPAFRDGAIWVSLAPLHEPAHAVTALAQQLEVGEESGRSLVDSVAASLAERECLLVLDNAEHLLPDLAATIARLRDAGGSTLLVTSRERLAVAGEHAWPVPPLHIADAVELFATRARALDPVFAATPAVAELCERLDNLPLALELAAARTMLFSPEQLLERLGERLDLLRGTRDADPRHRSLRAAIEWSYDLLDERERTLLASLSVFAGGCTLEAAEIVCAADADTLQSLLDKSLVRRRDTSVGPRFWLLETIRAFAAERLDESGRLEETKLRLLDWIADFAVAAEPGWREPDGQRWNEPFRLELDNIREALRFALAAGLPERALATASYLCWLWWENGPHGEGRDWVERSLAAAQPVEDVALEGYALLTIAILTAGGFDEPIMRQGLALLEEGGRRDAHGVGSYMLAGQIADRDPAAAEPLLDQLEADAFALGDPMLGALQTGSRGYLALRRDDLDTARQLLERHVQETEPLRSFLHAGAMGMLAELELRVGDYDRARELVADATAIAVRDDLYGTACGCYTCAAVTELLAGDLDEAERQLVPARGFRDRFGTDFAHAEIALIEAGLHAARGDGAAALASWQRAEALFPSGWPIGDRLVIERLLEPLRSPVP